MVEVMITSEGKQVKEEAELVVAVTLTRDADALHPEMKKRNVLRCMNSSEDTLGKVMTTRS